MGLVLCLRLAADPERPRGLRLAAAAGTVPLAVGLYLTFSRGALLAFAAGLIVLVVAAGTRSQLRAIAACALPCVGAVVAAGRSPSVRVLDGNQTVKEHQGAVMLVVLIAAVAAAVLLGWLATRHERHTDRAGDRLGLPRWSSAVATVVVVGLVAVPVAVGSGSPPTTRPDAAYGATNQRLVELGSNRAEYWRVALAVWADHPVIGVGSSGYAVEWFKRRRIGENLHDAHSLELETLAELGVVGGAILAALLGSVALAARHVHRADPVLAAGPVAALVVWLLHASLDWDWEMPAVTLVAVVLAGMLVARADTA
jgi:O-antigen ligase